MSGTYLLAAISILLGGIGQFLLKLGADRIKPAPTLLLTLWRLVLMPQLILGLLCFGSSFLLWIFVLRRLPLSVAYPMVSLNYLVVTLLAVLVLHERFTAYKALGLGLIMLGVVAISVRGSG